MPKEAGIHEQCGHHALKMPTQPTSEMAVSGGGWGDEGLCESVLKIMYSLNLEIEAGNNKRLCCSRDQYDG